jgi:hypothetical protein
MTLHGLGDVALVSGDAPAAARFYCEALGSTTESTPAANCLAGLAAAAALMRRVELAGQIWGAVESYQQRHGEQLIYPSTVTRYQTALDEVQGAEFAVAASIGHELTLDEASQRAVEALRL